VNKGSPLLRSHVSDVSRSHRLGLKEPIRQISPAAQELEYLQLRIVTQFKVEQAHLYIVNITSLPALESTHLSEHLSAHLSDSEQVQQLEQVITQFFCREKIKEGRFERNVSVIDRFELNAQRYCVVRMTPLTSSSLADVRETPRSAYQMGDRGDYFQAQLQALLSPREQEIICLIAAGLSNKQIASRLDISIWTVSAHLRRIFTKLKVDTRAAVVYQCSKLIWGWGQTYGLASMV
jgi:RNA polymerase sigma factor (sigma-70 family)